MISIEVTFEDGNKLKTGFNGSLEDARRYYVGQFFELTERGNAVDVVKGVSVKPLE